MVFASLPNWSASLPVEARIWMTGVQYLEAGDWLEKSNDAA
jgi:hypothetical protein